MRRPLRSSGAEDAESGYSLLETLAAVFILALASGVAVATLPPAEDPRETAALAFAAKLDRAGEEAVLSGLGVGVDVDENGYGFRRRAAGLWSPIEGARVFESRAWPTEASVEIVVDGDRRDARRFADIPEGPPSAPMIRFDPAGAATPAEVRIIYADVDYRVTLGADGAVAVEADDAP